MNRVCVVVARIAVLGVGSAVEQLSAVRCVSDSRSIGEVTAELLLFAAVRFDATSYLF